MSKIREFRNKDRQAIIFLMKEFGEYLQNLDLMGRTDFAKDGSTYFTDKLIKQTKTKNGKIFVCEETNKIIGFIGGYIHKQTQDELMEQKKAKPGVIIEFFVTQNSQRGGIGSQLLKTMENYFKQQGCTLVRLEVFALNKIARSFYSKQGYQDRTVFVSKDL